MDNTKIVEQLMKGFAKKSTEIMPLDENIVLISPLSSDKPYRGKEQVINFLNNIFQKIKVKDAVIEKNVTSGNIVCTIWKYILEPNITLHLFSYFETEKGKITVMRNFYDPRPILETFK